jgi:hypothetical protein
VAGPRQQGENGRERGDWVWESGRAREIIREGVMGLGEAVPVVLRE